MHKTWRTAALLTAGVLAAAGSGSTALAAGVVSQATTAGPATFANQAYSPLRVTGATRVTSDDPVPTRAFTGPYILVDPNNPKVVVASTVEARSRVCYLERSTDGGQTWATLANTPALPSYPFCFNVSGGVTQSPMAWGRNHTLYYGLIGYSNQDGGATSKADLSALLARSTDLGNTWTTTLVQNARGKTGTATEANYPVVAVAVDSSGSSDVVYVSFRQSHPQQPTAVNNSMISTSTDGGSTFSPPVNLNNFSSTSFTSSSGKTYPVTYSTPHVAAGDGMAWAVTQGSLPSAAHGPSQPIFVGTSTDHGKTWTMKAVSPVGASEPVIQWSALGGPQGTVMMVYQYKAGATAGTTQGSSDIYFQRSTDGGKTWSQPARLNDDNPDSLTYHLLPNMEVAPNGRVDVVWDDFRNAQSFADDVYYTYSTDDGATWAPNIRATDQLINLTLGINNNSDVRQPPGVGSSNQDAVIGWSDTRLGNTTTQTQDVFASVVQFKALPAGGNKTLRYLAAAAAGLALAGLIVVLIALARRRRGGIEPPPPASTTRERQPVGVA